MEGQLITSLELTHIDLGWTLWTFSWQYEKQVSFLAHLFWNTEPIHKLETGVALTVDVKDSQYFEY